MFKHDRQVNRSLTFLRDCAQLARTLDTTAGIVGMIDHVLTRCEAYGLQVYEYRIRLEALASEALEEIEINEDEAKEGAGKGKPLPRTAYLIREDLRELARRIAKHLHAVTQ